MPQVDDLIRYKKDVFISYKSEEFKTADWIRKNFEKNNISVWIAPDCIPGGSNYLKSIPKAIDNCKVFVLVLSTKAQLSDWVVREMEQALKKGKIIMPFAIEECELNDHFDLALSTVQRYAAYENMTAAMEKMISEIMAILKAQYNYELNELGGIEILEVEEEAKQPIQLPVVVEGKKSGCFKYFVLIIPAILAIITFCISRPESARILWDGLCEFVVGITPYGYPDAQNPLLRYPLHVFSVMTALIYIVGLGISFKELKNFGGGFLKFFVPTVLSMGFWHMGFRVCKYISLIPFWYPFFGFVLPILASLCMGVVLYVVMSTFLKFLDK